MLKPALLYADSVSLCSPIASMLSAVNVMASLDGEARIAFVEAFASTLRPGDPASTVGMRAYKSIKSKKRRSRSEILQMLRVEHELKRIWDKDLVPGIERLLTSSGADQLVGAVRAGVLQVESLIPETITDSEEIAERYVARIQEMLSDPSSYPLLDDDSGRLMRHAIREGVFKPVLAAEQNGKQVLIASDAMERLPVFPAATLDEVLDIRSELAVPLVRFRSAMIRMSRIAEGSPYEVEFQHELDTMYREHIAPALQEIKEMVDANSYLRQLAGQAVGNSGVVVSAMLALGLTFAADLPWVLDIAAPLTQLAASATWQSFGPGRDAIAKQEMFFLYRTGQLLNST